MLEKRRYKVTGFKAVEGITDVRVLLDCSDAVKFKPKDDKVSVRDMMANPMGIAQNLMSKQMKSMVRDTFLISKEVYDKRLYDVNDHVIVTIEKE